jgi:hypothetical protein
MDRPYNASMDITADEDSAPGWEAIDQALETLYSEEEPHHWGPEVPRLAGGEEPLDGVSAYPSERGGIPHWHYVSYGLTELFDKESDDAEVSGFGFELTFRLKRETEEDPPLWPVDLMQSLARYVFESGNPFAAGHGISVGGTIAHHLDSELTAITFIDDPELGAIETPYGRASFLQIVPLTEDEFEARKRWSTDELLALMRGGNPLLVTDLGRGSILNDESVRAAVEAGVQRDGSSLGEMLANVAWSEENGRYRVKIGVREATELVRAIGSRLQHNREFGLLGDEQGVAIFPSDEPAITVSEEALLMISVDNTVAAELKALPLAEGVHSINAIPVDFELA